MVNSTGDRVGVSSPEMARSFLLTLAVVLSIVVGIPIAIGFVVGPLYALVAVALLFGLVSLVLRDSVQVGIAVEKLDAHDLDGAEAAARRASGSLWVGRGGRGMALNVLSSCAWLRGDQDKALPLVRRAVAQLDRAGAAVQIVGTIARLNEIQLLALTGDVEGAAQKLDALGPVPDGQLARVHEIDTRLLVAFESSDAFRLPADLRPWFHAARDGEAATSTFVLLIWAFDQRGETDAIAEAAALARERERPSFAPAHPRLAQWWAGR
jgi:hypothetical protein